MKKNDFTDPFSAGQMVGMIVILTSIERSGGIDDNVLRKLKQQAADNVQGYFKKPSEDIFLMIDNMLNEIGTL